MAKSAGDYMKVIIGDLAAEIAILKSQNETQQERIEELERTILALEEIRKEGRS